MLAMVVAMRVMVPPFLLLMLSATMRISELVLVSSLVSVDHSLTAQVEQLIGVCARRRKRG
jgi:hypothetical protein